MRTLLQIAPILAALRRHKAAVLLLVLEIALTLAVLGTWQTGLTAGIGWIAVALVILAGWRPWLALIGAYAFGALRGLGFTLQIAQISIPSDFLNMTPFIAAYVVVVVVSASPSRSRRVAAPAALGEPYSRESR